MKETLSPASRREIIIGHANTIHDPAIAICEGEEVFAEAIERHTQCKRAMDLTRPWYSGRALVAWLRQVGKWPIQDADILTISSWSRSYGHANTPAVHPEDPPLNLLGLVFNGPTILEPIAEGQLVRILQGYPANVSPCRLDELTSRSKTLVHHLAHAANAVYTSPFEECMVMVIDGYGEGCAHSFFHFHDNRFELLHEGRPNVSLGLLYADVTQLCGFNAIEGEEWKVMGLAAFGRYRKDLYDFFKDRVVVNGLDVDFSFQSRDGTVLLPVNDHAAWIELEQRAGGFRQPWDTDILRSADLAHNFQLRFEEVVVELARNLAQLGFSKNLAFAGGCALNSSANGKLVPQTGFTRLHVPSAPGDDGNCLGALLHEKYHVRGEPRTPGAYTPYLGSQIDLGRLERALRFGGIKHHRASDDEALCDEVARLLAEGKIVAWMQGRAEFGPRALGNRSILADPRPAEMKDLINSRIKFREFYRPLAPSILAEFGDEYFEQYQPSPYMERALKLRPEAARKVPAVVHEDGSGRLQTVTKEANPLFHRLIRAFYDSTGVPLLVNTSFNVMGKPIVHSIEDALAVFYTSGLDRLVIGPYVLEK